MKGKAFILLKGNNAKCTPWSVKLEFIGANNFNFVEACRKSKVSAMEYTVQQTLLNLSSQKFRIRQETILLGNKRFFAKKCLFHALKIGLWCRESAILVSLFLNKV